MVHPVFRLATAQPLWLAEHVAAYGSLVSEELRLSALRLQHRLALQLVGSACLLLAFTLGGVALLLWAALPEQAAMRAPWLLWVVPLLPAVIGVMALTVARRPVSQEPFSRLRHQLGLDAALLRSAGAP